MRKWSAGLVTAAALVFSSSALAASSPAVTPGATTAITDTTVTLNGTVDPEGSATTYRFEYGLTTALGTFSPTTGASAGAGTAAVSEHVKLADLTPGTTYYFQLQAGNSSGSSSTPIESFKTAGNPPPGPTTGPSSNIERYQATMTGTIAPNSQTTYYYFQYGLTSTYGMQTATGTVPAGSTPVPIALTLAGLEPGTVFHYRLVATHGSTSTVYGADATFQTLPWPLPQTRFTWSITPHHARVPFSVFVHGRIGIPAGVAPALACTGVVRIRVTDNGHQLGSTTAPVNSGCGYGANARIHRLLGRQSRTGARLFVSVQYMGNAYIAPSRVGTSSAIHVK